MSVENEQTTESAPDASMSEAFRAKVVNSDIGESKEVSEQTEGKEGEPKVEKGTGAVKEAKEEGALEPDIQKYIDENKFDLGDLKDNETVKKILEKAHATNAELSKIKGENELREQKIKEKLAEKSAEDVIKAEGETKETAKKIEDMSPVERLDLDVQTAFKSLLAFTGAKDEEDLQAQYPEIYKNFVTEYQAAKEDAAIKYVDWKDDQKNKGASAKESEETIKKEWETVQATSKSRIEDAKKVDPDIVENFKLSGLNELLDQLAVITNIPVEYFVADEKFFNKFAQMAKAMRIVEGLPEEKRKIKQEVEKDIAKTKKGEMVSKDSALPDDQKAVFDRKTRFVKQTGVSLKD